MMYLSALFVALAADPEPIDIEAAVDRLEVAVEVRQAEIDELHELTRQLLEAVGYTAEQAAAEMQATAEDEREHERPEMLDEPDAATDTAAEFVGPLIIDDEQVAP